MCRAPPAGRSGRHPAKPPDPPTKPPSAPDAGASAASRAPRPWMFAGLRAFCLSPPLPGPLRWTQKRLCKRTSRSRPSRLLCARISLLVLRPHPYPSKIALFPQISGDLQPCPLKPYMRTKFHIEDSATSSPHPQKKLPLSKMRRKWPVLMVNGNIALLYHLFAGFRSAFYSQVFF